MGVIARNAQSSEPPTDGLQRFHGRSGVAAILQSLAQAEIRYGQVVCRNGVGVFAGLLDSLD